jgi:hypothetical protein
MFVAQLLFLFEPYILGKMIDGLLQKNYYWLICFILMIIIENLFIYRRMIYDTKVYTKIYNNIVLKYLKSDKANFDPSIRIARTEMSNDIISFLEGHIHYYIYAILSIIGTLTFVMMQSPLTGFVLISSILPILVIIYCFYNKIIQSTVVAHNHYEQKIKILTDNNDDIVETFFKRRRKVLIYSSTINGKNYVSLNLVRSIFLIIAMIIITNDIKISHGEVLSMYAYIGQFLSSLMSIPNGVETYSRMKDIISRLNQ